MRSSYVLGIMPVGVSMKSWRTLQWGVPCANHSVLPSSLIISRITLNANTKARATSADDVELKTLCVVFQILSRLASVLFLI